MKLAEALITRADIQNRISALEGRLNANAVVQEGEECAEDPRELIKQLNEMSGELEKLVARINLTNAAVTRDGETLTAMLPVLDNLERAIAAAESDTDPLVSGVQMTLRQMLDAMGKLGLEEVPALGEKFDPDIHNAVMRVQEGEPGTVCMVLQKGYKLGERVIRHAMVKVVAG